MLRFTPSRFLQPTLRLRSFNTTWSTSHSHSIPFPSSTVTSPSRSFTTRMPHQVYASTAPEATIKDSTMHGDLKGQQANVLKLEQISRDFRT